MLHFRKYSAVFSKGGKHVSVNELSFEQYNRDQIRLTRQHQEKLAHNKNIDTKGTWRDSQAMKPHDVLSNLAMLGINTNIKSLQRYANYDLMPKPKTRSLGQGQGSISIHSEDAHAEYAASYSLREGEFKQSLEVVKKARQIVKKAEVYIKPIDTALNKGYATNGKVYKYLINKELGEVIIEGCFGTISFDSDGNINSTPREITPSNFHLITASVWLQNKLKALAGFNPMDEGLRVDTIKKEKQREDDADEYLVDVYKANN